MAKVAKTRISQKWMYLQFKDLLLLTKCLMLLFNNLCNKNSLCNTNSLCINNNLCNKQLKMGLEQSNLRNEFRL